MEYKADDLIIGKLKLLEPCPIRIVVDDKAVRLYVGPRDWSWDRESGRPTGAGTGIIGTSWKRDLVEDEAKDGKEIP